MAVTRSTLQSGVQRITGGMLPDIVTSTGPLQAGAMGSSPQAIPATSSATNACSRVRGNRESDGCDDIITPDIGSQDGNPLLTYVRTTSTTRVISSIVL